MIWKSSSKRFSKAAPFIGLLLRLLVLAAGTLPAIVLCQNGAPANQPPDAAPAGQPPAPAPANPSTAVTVGTWDLGNIVPGVNYSMHYTLNNGCVPDQPVTFTYPGSIIPIDGPENVTVPGTGGNLAPMKIVDMDLEFPPVPPGPASYQWTGLGWQAIPPENVPPPPEDPAAPTCQNVAGSLVALHKQVQWDTPAQGGMLITTCLPVKENWQVVLCLYNQPAANSGGGGGGPQKPRQPAKKIPPGSSPPDGSTCSNLWYFDVFVPSGPIRSPQDCAAYIRAQAHDLFDRVLAPYRNLNPAQWAWAPAGTAIDQLTVEQILALKKRVFEALENVTP